MEDSIGSTRLDLLAAGPLDDLDAMVLSDVEAFYDAFDPPAADLAERMIFAISLAGLEAEVAELQRVDGAMSGARGEDLAGATEAQTVTFSSSSLTTMISINVSGERVRIDGWVAPACPAQIELSRDGLPDLVVDVDLDGRFVFESVPRGMARFVIRPEAASGLSIVVTPSLKL